MISKDKQYRTRDGREVRIYATDHGGDFSVIGAIKMTLEGWVHCTWKRDGFSHYGQEKHPTDLIEVKPRIKREYWVNVYPESIAWWTEKTQADMAYGRIACVKVVIDCEEGEGL